MTTLPRRLFQPVSVAHVFFILFALEFPYQYAFCYLSFFDSVLLASLDAILFTVILWITTRLDLARVTLCFLALPYLIFFPGWLNTATAVLLLIIFIYCITNTLRATTSTSNTSISFHDLLAFILIIIWINLSGAGGYGYQTPDYTIHNARLKDLIDYAWPVRYGENRNFVSYFGYFLPAAIIGKLGNADIAFRSMYPWTILGVTLALRWLSFLSRWRFSIALVLIFIIFGPLDILNVLVLGYHAGIPLASSVAEIQVNTDYLDFRTRYDIGFVIGNYLSNTFQLFWSPHQVIAGWLGISLITHLFLKKQTTQIIFTYALLCLWSPLIMIALFPFVLIILIAHSLNASWQDFISLENILGAGSLALVFVVFYISGSTTANPSFWLFNATDWHAHWFALVIFYLGAWGIYVLALLPFLTQTDNKNKTGVIALCLALLLLPCGMFGQWSDLLCRGSAPLMFLLLVFLLRAVHYYWGNRQWKMITLLVCLFITGSGSAIVANGVSLQHYGETQPVNTLASYPNAYPNFGPDGSLFERWFRRKLPAERAGK